jgi:hypothetical protein
VFKNLIPKIFYSRLDEGLEFCVDALGFELAWRDDTLAVVELDGAKAYLMQSPELAALDRPELAVETDARGKPGRGRLQPLRTPSLRSRACSV